MEGEGFTGFNPEQAKVDINNFQNNGYRVGVYLEDAFKKLFEDLYYYWCSPNAVAFDEKHHEASCNMISEVVYSVEALYIKFVSGYNEMARANGVDFYDSDGDRHEGGTIISSVGRRSETYLDFPNLRSAGKTGAVGMNVKKAQETLENFKTNILTVLSYIDKITSTIAFFDENGEIQPLIKTEISNLKRKIDNDVTTIVDEITKAFEIEEDTILLAQQKSTQTLNA